MKILLNLTESIIKPLDIKAEEYGMTRTALLQHIILNYYLEKLKDETNNNE